MIAIMEMLDNRSVRSVLMAVISLLSMMLYREYHPFKSATTNILNMAFLGQVSQAGRHAASTQ